MKYIFRPEHPGAVPASERGGSESMRTGGVYDLDPEWALIVAEGCPGLNGAPCFVPVDVVAPSVIVIIGSEDVTRGVPKVAAKRAKRPTPIS